MRQVSFVVRQQFSHLYIFAFLHFFRTFVAVMKKAITIEAQIALLRSRGLCVSDESKAVEVLFDIGYYRLGFYCFPFEASYPRLERRTHVFREGVSFDDVLELYYFDFDLRKTLLNFITRIEVNFRTKVSYIVSLHYAAKPVWFADRSVVEPRFVEMLTSSIYPEVRKNSVIERHHKHHPSDRFAPAWKTIEFLTLGKVEMLYKALREKSLKEEIARQYGCSYGVFLNYVETLRVLRNVCAHGNCLYNVHLSDGVKRGPISPSASEIHTLNGGLRVVHYLLSRVSTNRASDMRRQIAALVGGVSSVQTRKVVEMFIDINCVK